MKNLADQIQSNDETLTRVILKHPREVHCSPSFRRLVESFRDNSYVRTVVVGELAVQVMEEEELSELLVSLGGIRTLEQVEVAQPHINAAKSLSAACVASLIQRARNLKTLVLWPYVKIESTEEMHVVAEALNSHPNLSQLSFMNLLLGRSDDSICIDPILSSLVTINSLANVQISAGFRIQADRQVIRDESLLADLVRPGSPVKYLALRNLGLVDRHCIAMCDLLTELSDETKLKLLDVRFNDFTLESYPRLEQMLNENFVLEWLETDYEEKDWLERVTFSLKLNRAGRYTLLRNLKMSREDGVEVLIKSKDNLNTTYHLLRRHPSMCDSK